jgi:cation diffusion facilitator CzcD-associated flavoprotein CzcO
MARRGIDNAMTSCDIAGDGRLSPDAVFVGTGQLTDPVGPPVNGIRYRTPRRKAG